MYRKIICILPVMVLFFLCTAANGATKYKITYADGDKTVVVKQKSEEKWTAKEGASVYTVKIKEGEKVKFFLGEEEVAKGKLKNGKFVAKGSDGSFFMKLKFKENKIKVTLEEGAASWSFKYKENKVKVKREEQKYGKVKFYPDSGKLKAKDADGDTVAKIKGVEKLTAAPASFLISNLDERKRNFLMLLLFALGK